jgi:PST family polysaccharide transporter
MTTSEAQSLATPPRTELTELKRVAVRGGLVLLGTRLFVQAFTWIVTIMVARFLRPYDYGVITSGGIFVGLADLLVEAGFGKALVQRAHASADDLAECFTLSLLISSVLYALLFVAAESAARFMSTPDLVPYLRVVGVVLLLTPFRTIPLSLLERRLMMGSQSSLFLFSALIQSSMVLSLAMMGWGFWALAAGSIVARLLDAFLMSWRASWIPRLRQPRRSTATLIRFSLNVTGTAFLWYFYSNSDFAVVGHLTGPAALGYYALAYQLVSLPVQKLVANCNQISYPILCRLQDDPERLRRWFLRLTVMVGFISLPALVGMSLVADDAIPMILGEKWRPAVLPFQIMSCAGVVMILSASLPPLFIALGRPDITLKYALACFVLLPSSFYLVGRRYGVVGVATTWSTLYPLVVLALISMTRPVTGLGVTDFLRSHQFTLISLAFMIITVLVTRYSLSHEQSMWLRLGLSITAGVCSYGVASWVVARHIVLIELRTFWRELRGT